MTEEVFTGILNSFVTLSGVVDPLRCVLSTQNSIAIFHVDPYTIKY